MMIRKSMIAAGAALALAAGGQPGLVAEAAARSPEAARQPQAQPRTQQGRASFYHRRFHGRRMANGERFDANSNSAAHRSLPLGTVARVTNLENGRSAVVEVEDRGPYKRGRIIDVSPRTAERLEMRGEGTARVAVTPLHVPEQDQRVGPQAGR